MQIDLADPVLLAQLDTTPSRQSDSDNGSSQATNEVNPADAPAT